MLKHLLKYEFKATGRTYGGLYLALVALAVLSGFSLRSSSKDNFASLLLFAYMVVAVAVAVVSVMTIVTRFTRNLLGREGYLMHTLPVTESQLILSKLISSVVWMLCSSIVGIFSFAVMLLALSLNSAENQMLYSELQCSDAIHKAVERMGFAEMTEIQEKTIPVMMAGYDVIAKAPAGTGKTCAFGIPVAEHILPENKYPQAVIMAPTRELAQQIAQELEELTYFMPEVQVACVYGGANMEKQAKRLAEGCQIVVATPGRLMDHYKHHSIDISHVTQIVLDEADEMLNMGFYKDVRHIIEMMKARKSLSMFSATISREVMDIGWLYQHNAEEITVQPPGGEPAQDHPVYAGDLRPQQAFRPCTDHHW